MGKSLSVLSVEVHDYCPFGFQMNRWGFCECADEMTSFGFTCDINELSFTSPPNHWGSLYYNSSSNGQQLSKILFSTNCPPKYCVDTAQNFSIAGSNSSFSCLGNHTGIMCGQCVDSTSVVFGSDEC